MTSPPLASDPLALATSRLDGERVLVTGATGFLGGECVRRLARNCQVVATGRNRASLSELAEGSVTVLPLDLTSTSAAAELISCQPTAIVHCAARSSPWGPYSAFFSANVLATEAVLEAAKTLNIPLVHISTPAIYIDGTHQLDVSEDATLPSEFVNHYVATKHQAELAVVSHAERGGGSVAILRPQGITGGSDTTIAPRFLRVADRGVFPLIGGGRSLIDLTHVGNVVDAVVLALGATLEQAWEGAEVFNISNGDPRPTSELVRSFLAARPAGSRRVRLVSVPHKLLSGAAFVSELAARLTRSEPPITRYTVDLMGLSRTLNIDKAKERLGFTPLANTLEQAFADFFESAGPR